MYGIIHKNEKGYYKALFSLFFTDEPLTSVLEDLQSLTTAVLQEDESGSDSDSWHE